MLASAVLAPYQNSLTTSSSFKTNYQNPFAKAPSVVDPSEELAQAVNRYLLKQIGEQTRNYETLFERVLSGEQGFDGLVAAQRNAILWADLLNQQALACDLVRYESIAGLPHLHPADACRARENVRSHRMALAEPLVERIRLAYLFVYSGDFEKAKHAIDDAAAQEVPWQALMVSRVTEIFEGIKTLRDILKLQSAVCIEILFQECDSDRDGLITPGDLEAAKGRNCEVPAGVLSFLQTKFDIFGSAINRAELKAFLHSDWLYSAFKELIC